MDVTREVVLQIAGLAKIGVSEAETERLVREMGRIVDFAGKMSEADTQGIVPTTHAVQIQSVFREDAVIPSTPREEILANAPEQDEGCFLTPKVLD